MVGVLRPNFSELGDYGARRWPRLRVTPQAPWQARTTGSEGLRGLTRSQLFGRAWQLNAISLTLAVN